MSQGFKSVHALVPSSGPGSLQFVGGPSHIRCSLFKGVHSLGWAEGLCEGVGRSQPGCLMSYVFLELFECCGGCTVGFPLGWGLLGPGSHGSLGPNFNVQLKHSHL
ncbi:hypothetical protein ILYODFUR_036743 [Ilyodon furcidens]|uniref:Uncharacterized protein n=1 Tax=Ilyodon furcidens TaxID=33524 RepID=A0ABV0SSZ8_9TELE